MYANLNEFYSKYQWIVAGCFFTMENNIGKIVLQKLIDKAIEISLQGFGSGEESFFSFIIDENTDMFNLYVGDYQDTIHNYYKTEKNQEYVRWITHKWANNVFDPFIKILCTGYLIEGILYVRAATFKLSRYFHLDTFMDFLLEASGIAMHRGSMARGQLLCMLI